MINKLNALEGSINQKIFSLENKELINNLDKENMFKKVYELPGQMEEALCMSEKIRLNKLENKPSCVIISGVGGSAIAGDLIRVLLNNTCKIPILINRDYFEPGYVDHNTLVIASSYSGDTEETISSYRSAKEKGARIIALTTGGTLGKMVMEDNGDLIEMPRGLPPRAAVGYSLVFLITILSRLGQIHDMTSTIMNSISLLRKMNKQMNPEVSIQHNQAKQIAMKLAGKLPVIYGTVGTTDVIAQRWKTQICENAKSIAYYNAFPELNHNEIVGLEFPKDIVSKIVIVLLKDNKDYSRNKLRMDVTSEILNDKVSEIIEVNSEGENALERMLSLLYIGDYVSLYLAAAYGKDPTLIERIDFLKDKLARY